MSTYLCHHTIHIFGIWLQNKNWQDKVFIEFIIFTIFPADVRNFLYGRSVLQENNDMKEIDFYSMKECKKNYLLSTLQLLV